MQQIVEQARPIYPHAACLKKGNGLPQPERQLIGVGIEQDVHPPVNPLRIAIVPGSAQRSAEISLPAFVGDRIKRGGEEVDLLLWTGNACRQHAVEEPEGSSRLGERLAGCPLQAGTAPPRQAFRGA